MLFLYDSIIGSYTVLQKLYRERRYERFEFRRL